MKIYINPPEASWKELLARPSHDITDIETRVKPILQDVKENGDEAVYKYNAIYDKNLDKNFVVSRAEFQEADKILDKSLKSALKEARTNIKKFHSRQKTKLKRIETVPGVMCWRKNVPIQKVGLYVPGGTAPLFSTALMLGVPALLAGCEEIIMCTPAHDGKVHPAILYAASIAGISKIFKTGGAQAIGAMSYGTTTIPTVYKIFGPGNQYVTVAKQLVAKEGMAIDMPAGPSEVLVWTDQTAVPAFVAADLLSQAEHGPDSQVILVAHSAEFAQQVQEEIQKQRSALDRLEIIEQSLEKSRAIVMENTEVALKFVNEYAPEHLIIARKDADEQAERIVNAGSVFLGNYSPETAGDYASGPNHTLPTNGFAKAYSGVSLDSFFKKITFQKLSKEGLKNLAPTLETMAEHEQLQAHKNAVSIRLK